MTTDGEVATWVDYLLSAGLRGGTLLALAGMATLVSRRWSASTRHLMWAAGLGGVAAVTLLGGLLPQWRVAVVPARPLAVGALLGETAGAPERTAVLKSAAAAAAPTTWSAEAASATAPAFGRADFAVATAHGWLPRTILIGWAMVTMALLLRLVLGLRAAGRLVRTSAPLEDAGVHRLAVEVAAGAGLTGMPAVRLSRAVGSPVTAGVLRPVVLLPTEALTWPAERLRVVLAHEIAHVRRHDCASQLVARVIAAVHWWNPLVWLAERRMVIERERACDDHVLAGGVRASVYARHLVDIGQLVGQRSGATDAAAMPAGAFVVGCSGLATRVQTLLDARRSHRVPGRRAVAAVVVATLSLALPAGCLTGDPGEGARRLVYQTDPESRDETAQVLSRRLTEMGFADARVTLERSKRNNRLAVTLPAMPAAEVASVRTVLERRGALGIAVTDGADPIMRMMARQITAAAWGEGKWLGVQPMSEYLKGDEHGVPHPSLASVHGSRIALLRYLAQLPQRLPPRYGVLLKQSRDGAGFFTVIVDTEGGVQFEPLRDVRVIGPAAQDRDLLEVRVTPSPADAARLHALTSANVGRQLAVILLDDREVWGGLKLEGPVSEQLSVTVHSSRAEAERLAAGFRAGVLPAPIHLVHEQQ